MAAFGIIYRIKNEVNGKSYIGQTTVPLVVRIKRHRKENKCKAIYAAIKKYGWENFKVIVLCHCNNKNELDAFEKYYIKKYKSYFKDNGYNLTFGGEGCFGYRHTDQSKNKISKIHKGKTISDEHKKILSEVHSNRVYPPRTEEHTRNLIESRAGYVTSDETKLKLSKAFSGKNNPMYGKHHSEETKKKIIDSRSGYKHSQETIDKITRSGLKPVLQLDKDNNIIKEWKSIKEAGEHLKLDRGSISSCCNGKRYKKVGGFKWKFKKDIDR